MNKAVYPGSFDPITSGHLDIIKRASRFVDKLIVLVCTNPKKQSLFSIQKRVKMIENNILDLPNVEVNICQGLVVDFLKVKDIELIIRGLRAISDFEEEFKMALMNQKLKEDTETIMLVAKGKYQYLSSSAVKEVAQFNGCIKDLVPKNVEQELKNKF